MQNYVLNFILSCCPACHIFLVLPLAVESYLVWALPAKTVLSVFVLMLMSREMKGGSCIWAKWGRFVE